MKTSTKKTVHKKAGAKRSLGFIDSELLSQFGACSDGIAAFEDVFPRGTELTEAACIAGAGGHLDLYYFLDILTTACLYQDNYHSDASAARAALDTRITALGEAVLNDLGDLRLDADALSIDVDADSLRDEFESHHDSLTVAAANIDRAPAILAAYRVEVNAAKQAYFETVGKALWAALTAAKSAGELELEPREDDPES